MGDLVRGLADPEVKTIVLGEVKPKTDLKTILKLIQTKEYAKSTSSPQVVSEVTGESEVYNCRYSGGMHKKCIDNCLDTDKTCRNCSKTSHFAKVCRSRADKIKKKIKNQ